jgi:hypothetical protein
VEERGEGGGGEGVEFLEEELGLEGGGERGEGGAEEFLELRGAVGYVGV